MSGDLGDGDAGGGSRLEERSVARDEDDVRVMEPFRGSQVHGVVSAQPVDLGEIAGAMCESFVNLDDVHLGEEGVELFDRRA